MGFFARVFAPILRNSIPVAYPPTNMQWGPTPQQTYPGYARAYTNNEIVFSAIEMLATSASEPEICGRRFKRASPQVRNEEQRLLNFGVPRNEIKRRLISNGYYEELPNHPLVRLLNNPNPFMSRGQLWGTVVMDRAISGNAYLLKARAQGGMLKGAVMELWRLRPDRVKVIPSATNFIEGYEYNTGKEKIVFAADDVVHFKTRNPLNDYYGQSPLMVLAARLGIDDRMRQFLSSFYENGGTGPGSILSVKQKLSQEAKDQIRERFKRQFGGQGSYSELMVLDQAESTYQQMGLNRGLRDALPKELDAVTEARIAMVFGIPGSILGLLIGYESSSYANKRQDWQVFWDLTMTPLLSDLDDQLNLSLLPEFGLIDEVFFDLSDIRALQEDVDKLVDRYLKIFSSGLGSFEETREAIGFDPDVTEGTFWVPSNMVPTPLELIDNPPPPADPVPQIAAPAAMAEVRHSCKDGRSRLIARDVIGNPELWCEDCKARFRPIEEEEPRVISISVVRDAEGRAASLVGAE